MVDSLAQDVEGVRKGEACDVVEKEEVVADGEGTGGGLEEACEKGDENPPGGQEEGSRGEGADSGVVPENWIENVIYKYGEDGVTWLLSSLGCL